MSIESTASTTSTSSAISDKHLTKQEIDIMKELLRKIMHDPRFDLDNKTHSLYLQRALENVQLKKCCCGSNNDKNDSDTETNKCLVM